MTNDLTKQSLTSNLLEQAQVMLDSGLMPPALNSPAKIVAVMLRGRELGIGPMEACTSINVIQGKVTSSTQLMLALIYRSGQLEDIEMLRGDPAKVMMKRRGMTPHHVHFGSTEARPMGLLGKDNYKKQPETMFLWRAIAMCARLVFPDIVSAVYTPDELGMEINSDVQDSGYTVVEHEPALLYIGEPVVSLTDEQLTLAREVKATGSNYRQVAAVLSEKFGVEITKEQVQEALS